jgi:hypothetical protein
MSDTQESSLSVIDYNKKAFEEFKDKRNAKLESEGHLNGSPWHVRNTHYPTWEAACESINERMVPVLWKADLREQLEQAQTRVNQLEESIIDITCCRSQDEDEMLDKAIAVAQSGKPCAFVKKKQFEAVEEARSHMLRDSLCGSKMDVAEANAWLKVKVQHLRDEANNS